MSFRAPALMRHKKRGAAARPHSELGGGADVPGPCQVCTSRRAWIREGVVRTKVVPRSRVLRVQRPTRMSTTTLASGFWSASSARVGLLFASAGLALGSDPPGDGVFPWSVVVHRLLEFFALTGKAGGVGWLRGASQEARCVRHSPQVV